MNTLLIKKIRCNGSEFILTSLAQCIYLFQNVIQNKIFTTCFETSVFGQWSLLVSVYTLVSMLPFSAIDQGIYKVAHKCKESGKEAELCTTISVFYVLGFIIYSLIPVFSEQLVSLFSSIITFVTDVGTKFDIDISPIRTTLYDAFNKISANIGKYISDGAVNMLNASINFVSNFIIVFVCFIYFLSDMDKIRNDVKVYFLN